MQRKEGGGKKPLSIHKPESGEFGFEDILGGNDEITLMEEIEFLKTILKNNFGESYLKGMGSYKTNFPRKVVKGLVEEVWKFGLKDVPKKVSYQLFVDSKMQRFLWTFYKNSPINAIQDAYPDEFFEWEFNKVPNSFWSRKEGYENSLSAIKWMVDKFKLKGNEKRVPLGYEEFSKQGLGRPLSLYFSDSPFLALKTVFPNLEEWQMQSVPRKFYDDKKNHKIALESLLQGLGFPSFEGLSSEEIYDCNPRKISRKHFEEKRLSGLLNKYNRSIYDTFDAVYPGKTYPWFFSHSKRNLGDVREGSAKAIRWLFEDYLQIPKEKIPLYATNDLFWRVGFSGILTKRSLGLNSSPYAAIDLAYPNEFSKGQFKQKRKIKKIILSRDFRIN